MKANFLSPRAGMGGDFFVGEFQRPEPALVETARTDELPKLQPNRTRLRLRASEVGRGRHRQGRVMHYYKRHLGDYARKAGHLSMLEHGAYNLILDAYYDREVPPTRAEAIRFARARSAEEIAAVDVVLAEFFTESDEGWPPPQVAGP